MNISKIPPRFAPTEKLRAEPFGVNLLIETPKGTRHKYAWNPEFEVVELSRTLKAGMVWPCDFGFIPQTLADDGDALDVCLLIDEGTFPGCLVQARLVGSIGFVKNGGQNDRLLAVPATKKGAGSHWSEIQNLNDVSPRLIAEIESFLSDYNLFEGHKIELSGRGDRDEANRLVELAIAKFVAQI